MATYLIVGGAGYIGSHVVKALCARGARVLVLDDLSRGHRAAAGGATLIEGNLGDRALLDAVLGAEAVDCVMHFAALIEVGESVIVPLTYYENNVARTLVLLDAMRKHGVDRFIFSSTAAVYGEPQRVPIDEAQPLAPQSPYGWSKRVVEQMLADCAAAHGLRYVSLRYFNAAGADPSGSIGEDHRPESHLIPLVLQVALGQREQIAIYGTDWDTPDGTCVRDYIHVSDLARAHLLAAEHLLAGGASAVFNLGCQEGHSVRTIIELARTVTGAPIPEQAAPRRPGDPARLVASSAKIRDALGWEPRYGDPRTIVETAWRWHKAHPRGYGDR
jgi:UDP-glucose 4-epimerase